MSDPRFQHTRDELNRVLEVLETLNDGADDGSPVLGFEGVITVYWCECVMGTIEKDVDGDEWCYFPTAQGDKPEQQA